MNDERRARIKRLIRSLEDISNAVDELHSEEEEAKESMPESIQDGEKGQKMDEAINALEYARDSVDEAVEHLEEARS